MSFKTFFRRYFFFFFFTEDIITLLTIILSVAYRWWEVILGIILWYTIMSYFVYYLIFSLVQKCVVHTKFDIFESWTHKTNLTPPPSRVISVSLQESERSGICVSGILILSMFLRFCDWILELLPQYVFFLFVLLFIIYDNGKVQWPSHVHITIWFDKATAMKH